MKNKAQYSVKMLRQTHTHTHRERERERERETKVVCHFDFARHRKQGNARAGVVSRLLAVGQELLDVRVRNTASVCVRHRVIFLASNCRHTHVCVCVCVRARASVCVHKTTQKRCVVMTLLDIHFARHEKQGPTSSHSVTYTGSCFYVEQSEKDTPLCALCVRCTRQCPPEYSLSLFPSLSLSLSL
jgi:hypothetical protein